MTINFGDTHIEIGWECSLNDNLGTLLAHADLMGTKFSATGNNRFMSCKAKCSVKFANAMPVNNKVKLKIKLVDKDDLGLTEVNQTVRVKMKKMGFGKYKGKFKYDSGRASCSGRGTLWLDNGAVIIKLGLTNGESPLFSKKRLRRK